MPSRRHLLCLGATLSVALGASCGGEPEPRPEAPHAESPPPASEASQTGAAVEEPAAEEPTEPATEAGPEFEAPFPDDPCPTTALALSHRSHPVPSSLAHAVALRSEDGRFVRVAIAAEPLTRDARGRFTPPTDAAVRFEFEAIRRRRGPLEPGALGRPDSRRTALSHARVITSGPLLTFGHREVGRVELTHVDEERVCGRVDLNDSFLRVRGPFTAEVLGVPPP
ncbi:MAG: hypothetical protein AB8I08_00110 [Sandaracinaceae bacterium]